MKHESLVISPPNLKTADFFIRGTSPYVQCAFSEKAKNEMQEKQEKGSQAKKNTKKQAKDFKACYEGAKHLSKEGWCGIPCTAFRNACISACKICGFQMTRAKLSIFVLPDGFDRNSAEGLVRITKGESRMVIHPVRIQMTTDLRPRPLWDEGWEAKVRRSFDLDQFSLEDVTNLLMRVGLQVGVGEGRHDSKTSCGMGWGCFEILGELK